MGVWHGHGGGIGGSFFTRYHYSMLSFFLSPFHIYLCTSILIAHHNMKYHDHLSFLDPPWHTIPPITASYSQQLMAGLSMYQNHAPSAPLRPRHKHNPCSCYPRRIPRPRYAAAYVAIRFHNQQQSSQLFGEFSYKRSIDFSLPSGGPRDWVSGFAVMCCC